MVLDGAIVVVAVVVGCASFDFGAGAVRIKLRLSLVTVTQRSSAEFLAVTCFSAFTTVAWNDTNTASSGDVLVDAVEGLCFVLSSAVGLVGAVITALLESTRV